jgi:dolichol kinase
MRRSGRLGWRGAVEVHDPASNLEVVSRSPRASLTRKLIHLAMAIIPAAGWWISYGLALALAIAMLGASLIVETVRRWWPWLNHLLWRLLPTVFREAESIRVLGSTWFAVGTVAALLLFGRDAGGTAVLFLCWGDPLAEIVGRRWGRAGQGKTVAGSLGCLLACMVAGIVGVGLGGLSPWAVLVGAAVATLVERWSPPPNDNLWMPVLSGLAMAMTQWLVGGELALLPVWR